MPGTRAPSHVQQCRYAVPYLVAFLYERTEYATAVVLRSRHGPAVGLPYSVLRETTLKHTRCSAAAGRAPGPELTATIAHDSYQSYSDDAGQHRFRLGVRAAACGRLFPSSFGQVADADLRC